MHHEKTSSKIKQFCLIEYDKYRPVEDCFRHKMKQEFYQDFMDLYWADEYNNGCSDMISFYREEEYDSCLEDYEMKYREDYVMISRKIKIEEVSDIKKFVDKAGKYGDDLIIKGVNYEFPACSLMSVMSLVDLSQSVKLCFLEDMLDLVLDDFKKWIVT